MQRDKYYETLRHIENRIAELDVETLNQLLEQTFQVKPVRLKWYLIKAQVMLKEGKKVAEIKDFLSDKCAPWYEYDDVEEYFQLFSILSEYDGDLPDSQRYLYQLEKLKYQENIVRKVSEELNALADKILNSKEPDLRDIVRLSELYYISGDIYLYMLWVVVADKVYNAGLEIRSWILEKINVEYFYERLTEKETETFVILSTSDLKENACLLTERALKLLNKFPRVIQDFQKAEALLQEIAEKYSENNLVTVLGSGMAIEELSMSASIKPKLERLTEAQYDYMEDRMAVGRYGDYLSYIARIYKTTREEIEKKLYQKPTCRFSIIIPCRNAGETLLYTLKTCLNQTYQGEYEILVSDNSDMSWEKDTPTYRICQEIQSAKIRYIRTPRNLPLAKNFEYAYLHSCGEFLISMGADDGILPWALEELDSIIMEYPDQPVLLWHEAFYKWADVDARIMGGGGKAILQVNHPYMKNSPNINSYNAGELLRKSFETYGVLYYMPQVYHNCGIRREYMQSIYEKCGALWAGGQQDIFMAVVNSILQKNIFMIENLFTITGISNNSIGANARIGNTSLRQIPLAKKMRSTFCQGYRAPSYIERMFPSFGTEMGVLYTAVLCAYALGVVPDEVLNQMEWKSMFERVIPSVSILDVLFDVKWHWMRYVISSHGEELLTWFDNNYFYQRLEPSLVKIQDGQKEDQGDGGESVIIEGKELQVEPHSIDDVYNVSVFLQKVYAGE